MAASTRSGQLAVSDTEHPGRRDVSRRADPAASATASVVFVVDDDASVRDSLGRLISSVGFKVETFANARAFLGARRPEAPGCVGLDVRLPGLSGLDLQRELAETDAALPIVFLTGHGDIPMSVQAMKAGAVEFLTKPFRQQNLLDAIRSAIERDRTMRADRAERAELSRDRKSTRLNSSHTVISYAVFCLKKKKRRYQKYQEMQAEYDILPKRESEKHVRSTEHSSNDTRCPALGGQLSNLPGSQAQCKADH